jgi:hypothetical protein
VRSARCEVRGAWWEVGSERWEGAGWCEGARARGVGFLMGARRSGRRVDWLDGFGDATHVGVGGLLGVDPR